MNGEGHIGLIGPYPLDSYERMDRERIHLLLIDDAQRGTEDIQAGRTFVADPAIAQIQQRRAASNSGKPGSRWRQGHQLSQGESTRDTHP